MLSSFDFIATIICLINAVLSLMERWKRRKKKNHD